jgi:hypothetical protein
MKQNNSRTRKNNHLLLSLLLAFGFLLFFITRGINLPFVGYNAWNFNTYSLIAHNYNVFGYIETKLAPITNVSETLPDNPTYYLHHPPLISIILSIFFRLLGETFWVGRLVVILFSLGSVLLLYLLAKNLKNSKYALFVVAVAVLLPATSVFGRMIGQEPLVLFFCLGALYFLLRYFSTRNTRFAAMSVLFIIFGTLSDWQTTYFSVLLFLLAMVKKEWKIGLLLIVTAAVTETVFLTYVYLLMGGFSDLLTAISNRSLGELLSMPFWPLRWLVLITLRLILYFNPIFVVISFSVLFFTSRLLLQRKITLERVLIIVLFLFGMLNVLLYPEGSFGHAYWIYYFIPFIAFATADVLYTLFKKKKYYLLVLIGLFSIFFLYRIEHWKRKEVEANVWRYELFRRVNEHLHPYEKVLVNKDSVIDEDLIGYVFKHEVEKAEPDNLATLSEKYRVYIFSCMSCSAFPNEVQQLQNVYEHKLFTASEGKIILFQLKKRSQSHLQTTKVTTENKVKVMTPNLPDREHLLRKLYRDIKAFLNAPQI